MLHLKITRQRNDFLHKQSTNIANAFSACYVENLKLQNMDKLNSTLSRRMKDSGFGQLKELLKYKFKNQSKHFDTVNPAYTSQTCSACGEVDKGSRRSQSEYVCTSCGHTENADKNAAKNIRVKGILSGTKRKAVA
jgi:putative transposase